MHTYILATNSVWQLACRMHRENSATAMAAAFMQLFCRSQPSPPLGNAGEAAVPSTLQCGAHVQYITRRCCRRFVDFTTGSSQVRPLLADLEQERCHTFAGTWNKFWGHKMGPKTVHKSDPRTLPMRKETTLFPQVNQRVGTNLGPKQ